MLVVGLALGSLGGLDTAAREHFAGFKPHTLGAGGRADGRRRGASCTSAQLPWPVVTVGAVAAVRLARFSCCGGRYAH